MGDSGTLTLRTRNAGQDRIEIMVEDTGCGMTPEVLAKAMDPFFTTKDIGKGTGLGLSLVYSTVKAHLGTVDIQSEPGRGTRVRLLLPTSEAEPEAPVPAVEREAEPAGRLQVLLVDDDDLIRSSMGAVLEMLGHALMAVPSGEEALAMLETGFVPDVVILDMNMPGLGGAGTLPRLRSLLPTVPILLATGRADQAAVDLSRAHPHVTLLAKPFNMAMLKKQLGMLTPARAE
jgi:CheY-like chemotaxis protein